MSRTTPCRSCPYRKDAPLQLWHKSEFENLLAHDADEVSGAIFNCHGESKKPPNTDRELCIGWFLDQKRRGFPSLQLRLRLFSHGPTQRLYEKANAGGVKMFRTLRAMCRANGATVARYKPP